MRKNVKRASLVLALTPMLAVPATAALAATTAPAGTVTTAVTGQTPTTQTASGGSGSTTTTTTSTDAPPASASAVAAKVDGVVTIGETGATAGSSGGTAHAHALDLLGQTVAGGDATAGKSTSGALIATPDNPIGDLEIAPWSGKVTTDGTGTQSQAEAALAHAGLLGVLQLWLLHSQSQASWTPDASHGQATSDGGELNLDNQLDVKVLHAETDSNGKGSSALLVINGQGIATSDQANGACKIGLDPIANILCLEAAGGKGANGATTQTAAVLTETGMLPTGDVVSTKSSGGKAPSPATPTTSTSGSKKPENGPLPNTDGPSSSTSGKLPFTGTEAALLAAYGALLTGLGAAITVAARRRRGGAAATA